jgi:hypothetical protein
VAACRGVAAVASAGEEQTLASRIAIAVWIAACIAGSIHLRPAAADEPVKSAPDSAAAVKADEPTKGSDFETIAIRGRVVWLADALKQRYGINTVPEAGERILALQTPDGQLHPIIEDTRGRAFRIDKRLRDADMELLVRRYAGSPMIQVIRVYAIKQDGKYELDYWCDVCAIVMFQMGPCDCCQDDNRLRERRVK